MQPYLSLSKSTALALVKHVRVGIRRRRITAGKQCSIRDPPRRRSGLIRSPPIVGVGFVAQGGDSMVSALLCLSTAAHFPIRQQPNPMLSALMLTKAAHLAVADLAEIAVGTSTDTCRAIARSEAPPAMDIRMRLDYFAADSVASTKK